MFPGVCERCKQWQCVCPRRRPRDWGHFALMLFGPIVICSAIGLIFSLNCATVTDPPPNWPADPSCAQDPSGPTCYPPLHDERARDR